MDRVRLASPSKINLHLRVAPPTADGFHPLRSWMVTTSLRDTIDLRVVPMPGVTLRCDEPSIPTERTNLVVKAAERLLEQLPAAQRIGLEIDLAKRIPAGAGLGGGSGNAAYTLRGIQRLIDARAIESRVLRSDGGKHTVLDGTNDEPTRTNEEASSVIDESTLFGLAASLGSDVPFFLGAPSAIATGRGERLTPAPPPAARHALLILPPFPVATARAYRVLDELRPTASPSILDPFDVDEWSTLKANELLPRLVNDLEVPAFAIEPRLDELRREIETILGRIVRMSGSGSTLFTLFDTAADADAASSALQTAMKLDVPSREDSGVLENGNIRLAMVKLAITPEP